MPDGKNGGEKGISSSVSTFTSSRWSRRGKSSRGRALLLLLASEESGVGGKWCGEREGAERQGSGLTSSMPLRCWPAQSVRPLANNGTGGGVHGLEVCEVLECLRSQWRNHFSRGGEVGWRRGRARHGVHGFGWGSERRWAVALVPGRGAWGRGEAERRAGEG